MTQGVEKSNRDCKAFGLLAFLANITLAYPLLFLLLLYAEWLLAWYLLGHKPEWSTDDPAEIDGAVWLHVLSWLVIYGLMPAAAAAVVLNTIYMIRRDYSEGKIVVRVVIGLAIWFGMRVLLYTDPGGVMNWWLD